MGQRETVYSIICGCLFGAAWWMVIDAGAYAEHKDDPQKLEFVFVLPTLGCTVALVLMNFFYWGDLDDGAGGARCMFFTSIFIMLGGIIGSVAVLVTKYSGDAKADYRWPGAALLLSNVLILASSVLWRYASASSDAL